jgi:hypothetical protein
MEDVMRVFITAVAAAIVGFVLVAGATVFNLESHQPRPATSPENRLRTKPGSLTVEEAIRVVLERGQDIAIEQRSRS